MPVPVGHLDDPLGVDDERARHLHEGPAVQPALDGLPAQVRLEEWQCHLRAEHLCGRGSDQPVGAVRRPVRVHQALERLPHPLRELRGIRRRALADEHDARSEIVEALSVLAKLDDLRLTERAAEVSEEHNHGRLPPPVAREDRLFGRRVEQRDIRGGVVNGRARHTPPLTSRSSGTGRRPAGPRPPPRRAEAS